MDFTLTFFGLVFKSYTVLQWISNQIFFFDKVCQGEHFGTYCK